tara:strand:+ start:170 stop:1033 length:864 start_codon:yes stop_codon:yes gene_type:complete
VKIQKNKLHRKFGVKITGFDMKINTKPEDILMLKTLLDDHAVCAVPHKKPLSDAEHIAFSGLLGPVARRSAPKISGTGLRLPYNEIVDQSNLDAQGNIYPDRDKRLAYKRANRQWHTDMSYRTNRATWSLLSAHVVPPKGGQTEVADMRAVYDDLPDKMKLLLEDLTAEHCYWHSRVLGGGPEPTPEERITRPPARHPLVHVHPTSGRRVLYVASHIRSISGMPKNEAIDLLNELKEIAIKPEYVLSYNWTVGDVLIWDNLATMHRGTDFDDQHYIRDMRRVTCREN